MHIQEGTHTTLTTCTKMTEEVDRRHGVNGNSSGKGADDEPPGQSSAQTATGGRLKFFKDGKFILELVRGSAREGERAGWVSVPRKTFWPPAAAPPTPPHAAPPCASLSLSDDNSSLHSSPSASHRDHAWKQPAPRRNLAAQLQLYYCRPGALTAAHIRQAARRKRRRPFDPAPHPLPGLLNGAFRKPNGLCERRTAPSDAAPGDDVVDAPPPDDERWMDCDREKYYHMKLKKPYQYHKLRVYKKTKPPVGRKELNRTIDRLREKIAALPVLVNAKLASCRQEHAMVSPRKRILREMERVSLEDQASKRRAKTVPALSTASYPPSPGPSHSVRAPNGSAPRRDAPAKHVSSYSIHSLLSMPDDARRSPEPKRSPHSQPPSLKTESPASLASPDLSPSPDGYRYRYSALALGSPGRGAARDSPTPPQPGAAPAFRAYASPASPYGARAWPAPAPAYARRDEWAGGGAQYVYGYGYVPHVYRAAPPLWMHYALAPGAPPGPWAPLPHPLLTDHIPKDEPTSDLPLNLSKH
ncbi:serine/arginine repetitive matrix protein 1-like [Maniola jurtina]|uniref:serine/arginine repetitive matrix protein 1-like n=1 Tax=Maniola jurtina TaxID=191418 RepID=UPI001E68C5A7|nr:serine/arginine repetitive matrix protein 1-like [Maniola jurtina]